MRVSAFLALVFVLGCRSFGKPPQAAPADEPDAPISSNDPALAPDTRSCVAEVGCPDAKPIPPCEGEVDGVISAVDLSNQWDALDGQTVHVVDQLHIHPGLCTDMACGPDVACCNSCGGHLGFMPLRDLYLGEGPSEYSCTGDDSGICCDLQVPNEPVRVSGRVGKDKYGYQHLSDPVICVPAG